MTRAELIELLNSVNGEPASEPLKRVGPRHYAVMCLDGVVTRYLDGLRVEQFPPGALVVPEQGSGEPVRLCGRAVNPADLTGNPWAFEAWR